MLFLNVIILCMATLPRALVMIMNAVTPYATDMHLVFLNEWQLFLSCTCSVCNLLLIRVCDVLLAMHFIANTLFTKMWAE